MARAGMSDQDRSCPSVWGDVRCGLPDGHESPHRARTDGDALLSWADKGDQVRDASGPGSSNDDERPPRPERGGGSLP
jgi:hypothetical protein